jgi:OOP family OmpA-OmpF porin
VRGDQQISGAVVADYAHTPLVLRTEDGSDRADVVSGQLYLHALLAYSLWDRLRLSLAIPFAADNRGQEVKPPDGPAIPGPRGAALGDISLGGRLRLVGPSARLPVAISAALRVWVPSGQRAAYTGDGKPRGAIDLSLGGQGPLGVIWSAAAAFTLRRRAQLHGLISDDELQLSGAAGSRLLRGRLLVGPELVASVVPGNGAGRSVLAQLLLSARYQLGALLFGLAAGPGLGRASGSPAVRVLASVGYAPALRAGAPAGLPGAAELVLGRPGTADESAAASPGSSAADRDGDGIADRDDHCPRERGARSDDPTANGCPTLVRVTEQQIVTLKKVHFVSGAARLQPDASTLLSQVAQVLKEHPEIRRISIDGHTDGRGRPQRNLELSTARAQVVRQWLIGHGVAAHRMEARGFGATRPLGPDLTEEGRERNRRVEFRILDPAPVDVSATEGGVRR